MREIVFYHFLEKYLFFDLFIYIKYWEALFMMQWEKLTNDYFKIISSIGLILIILGVVNIRFMNFGFGVLIAVAILYFLRNRNLKKQNK